MQKKMLLIDDDNDDRALFSEALSQVARSIVLYQAESAEEGLKLLQNGPAFTPDLIFLDINLPLMSGWECLKELKSGRTIKNIDVIMYSTSSNKRDREIAAGLGALGFITKPFSYASLKNILQMIVAHINDPNELIKACNKIEHSDMSRL